MLHAELLLFTHPVTREDFNSQPLYLKIRQKNQGITAALMPVSSTGFP